MSNIHLHADLTPAARSSRSQSSSSSMSLRHEQGLTPFPMSQCWNMSLQHASGSVGWVALITASLVPLLSNSNWSPNFCHFGVTVSMILILPPEVFSRDSFPSVGVVSTSVCAYMHVYMIVYTRRAEMMVVRTSGKFF